MPFGPQIQSGEFGQTSGDRNSIAQQVLGGLLNTVRQGSDMQTLVNRYWRD